MLHDYNITVFVLSLQVKMNGIFVVPVIVKRAKTYFPFCNKE